MSKDILVSRRSAISALAASVLTSPNAAWAQVQNVRFGILAQEPDGSYALKTETQTIPRHYKETGFRFGIAFDNPNRDQITWYEVVHLPLEPSAATGNLRKDAPRTLKTDVQESDQSQIVDDFWFDEGDPLGKHEMQLYVNDQVVYKVSFNVVRA